MPIQVQEASRIPKWLEQNTTTPWHYYHWNNKHREQRKNTEGCKREKTNNTVNPWKLQQISQWKP
jgi:hypothetical protein